MSNEAPATTTTPAARPRILYVDDQQGNLVVFKATFKRYLEVVTASSAREALGILEKDEFPVVISDQRMGEMNGTDFLAEVRKRWPDSARMLLTAYTDFDDVVRAINDGQVTRFIHKPWEREDLLGAILNAATLYEKSKENRQLTEQLLHRERLAAIGQVTSGLVHELGNIAAVLSVAEDMKEDMAKGADVSRELEILQGGIEKFMALVESLRIYSKGGNQLDIIKKPIEIGKALSTTLVLLKLFPQVKTLKTLEISAPKEPIVVSIDAKKIEQVILNVVKNAAESVPSGTGEVRIEVRPEPANVIIEITDNGPGIPPPAWKKIWEGFYTTKGDKGTGLGLAMCRKIMEAHGGSIAFENLPRGGCTFMLRIPR
jgi:two-component system sensor histidine kinase/response regulator